MTPRQIWIQNQSAKIDVIAEKIELANEKLLVYLGKIDPLEEKEE